MADRRVTIKDVAARAGVSWKTVSNVVHERPVVRAETRSKVESAIRELGYVPNALGRDLRGGSPRVIAMLVPELVNPYFAHLAERMQVIAAERGFDVQIEVSLGRREVELAHLQGRLERPVAAAIISPACLTGRDLGTRSTALPVVMLGERVPAGQGVSHVAIDNVGSAADAVRHLVTSGRRKLLFLGAERPGQSTGAERLLGFRTAMRAMGVEPSRDCELSVREWTRSDGADAIARALDAGVEFDAIVAANDLLAIGALAALRGAGVSVPDDVAVIGWDGIEEGRFASPTLTTIEPDVDALVHASLDAAVGEKDPDGREVVVPHRLIARESA